MKISPKYCSLVIVRKNQVQGQTSSPAVRLEARDHSVHNIPETHAKLEGKFQLTFLVSAEKQAPHPEKFEDMHYNLLQKIRCRTLRRAVF
jgi:hypothetical protein